MPRSFQVVRTVCLIALLSGLAANAAAQSLSEDKGHVYRWNKFTDDLHALHKRQLAGRSIRIEKSVGGYATHPQFYLQEKFFDADSGLLLATIQWERAQPDAIHSIVVYRHDEEGRVLRDYSSTYLPDYRNAPSQTLIFVHRYNDDLHAFRSFDASGDLLYERCEGEFDGQDVFISLDIDEMEQAMTERYQNNSGPMTEPDYLSCFSDMPDTAKGVLPPR